MSRIGRKVIELPQSVEVKIENNKIFVKGPKGELDFGLDRRIKVIIEEKILKVEKKSSDKTANSFHGLTRSLIANMIIGVTQGYDKKLEVIGVGYKIHLQGNQLVLNVGYSHPVNINAPEGISFSVQKNTITVSGINKQLVGETAAQIRKIRKPEPYKGKGIRYLGEQVKRKAGKAAKSGSSGSA